MDLFFFPFLFFPDKFDQFWAVNRRLMEILPGEEGFRYVPIRLFDKDRPLLQVWNQNLLVRVFFTLFYVWLVRRRFQGLYKSLNGHKQRRTVKDLLKEVLPDRDGEQGLRNLFIQTYLSPYPFFYL